MQNIEKFNNFKIIAFTKLKSLNIAEKIFLSLLMAVFTGISAKIRIYLPFTPVPVTGQVFMALASGVVLGKYFGSLSQLIYLGIGLIGVPWFSGSAAGIAYVTGCTGGYIIGFIPAAFLTGLVLEKFSWVKKGIPLFILMCAGVGMIYTFGALQFSLVLNKNLQETLRMAVIPFILIDIVKALAAAFFSYIILPRNKS